jgi:hypothetical protein
VGDDVVIRGVFSNANETTTVFNGLISDPGVEYSDSTFSNETETIDVVANGFRWQYTHRGSGDTSFSSTDFITIAGLDVFDDPLGGLISDI